MHGKESVEGKVPDICWCWMRIHAPLARPGARNSRQDAQPKFSSNTLANQRATRREYHLFEMMRLPMGTRTVLAAGKFHSGCPGTRF